MFICSSSQTFGINHGEVDAEWKPECDRCWLCGFSKNSDGVAIGVEEAVEEAEEAREGGLEENKWALLEIPLDPDPILEPDAERIILDMAEKMDCGTGTASKAWGVEVVGELLLVLLRVSLEGLVSMGDEVGFAIGEQPLEGVFELFWRAWKCMEGSATSRRKDMLKEGYETKEKQRESMRVVCGLLGCVCVCVRVCMSQKKTAGPQTGCMGWMWSVCVGWVDG